MPAVVADQVGFLGVALNDARDIATRDPSFLKALYTIAAPARECERAEYGSAESDFATPSIFAFANYNILTYPQSTWNLRLTVANPVSFISGPRIRRLLTRSSSKL